MRVLDLVGLNQQQVATLADEKIEVVTKATETIDAVYGWGPQAAALLDQGPSFHFVQSFSAGVDYFPLAALKAANVELANTSGIHAVPIAESVLGYLLAFGRGVIDDKMIFTLENKQAIVYGTGNIGRQIATYLRALGVTVVGVNTHGEAVAPFDRTVAMVDADPAQADFIINVLPLTPQTHHHFDARFFKHLSKQPIFVNVGRGQSVDQSALVSALKQNQISGAALDVFEQEPLPQNDPLRQLKHVILTPHISALGRNLKEEAFKVLEANLIALKNNTPRTHLVDLNAGY
ncbi:NAD(P)-dependent oxidoreductase [Lacticaseibacillus saniviri]